MPARRQRIAAAWLAALAWFLLPLAVCGCGRDATHGSTTRGPGLANPPTAAQGSSTVVGPDGEAGSFAEVWAASTSAAERLGSTRVTITETSRGRFWEQGPDGEPTDSGVAVTQALQLLDTPAGRARLEVRGPGGTLKTTVVNGREEVTLSGASGSVTTVTGGVVSYGRRVWLEPPVGLPLPLWAGSMVAPGQGYADIPAAISEAPGPSATPEYDVVQLPDGGRRLAWTWSRDRWTSKGTLLLDTEFLPVRLDASGQGEIPAGSEIPAGTRAEFIQSLTYEFEQDASFSAEDFSLEPPDTYWRRGVTYELSLEGPRSEHADWGQYWLGDHVDEWQLVRAEHVSYEDDPDLGAGAEPPDEFVSLIYERPAAESENENLQLMARPPRGRQAEDSLAFAEERVAAGDWMRQEITIDGVATTAYGPLEGGATNCAESLMLFLPDAYVEVQLWAPVDPEVVLQAVRRVE